MSKEKENVLILLTPIWSLMTPLTTPIFDFHLVISALTTPLTTTMCLNNYLFSILSFKRISSKAKLSLLAVIYICWCLFIYFSAPSPPATTTTTVFIFEGGSLLREPLSLNQISKYIYLLQKK